MYMVIRGMGATTRSPMRFVPDARAPPLNGAHGTADEPTTRRAAYEF